MTAGVPGSGIGGFFYLLSALLMPVNETLSVCRKKSSRKSRQVVCRQVLNALGVLLGVWLTGWFISTAVSMVVAETGAKPAVFIRPWTGLAYGLITLLGVFLLVQILSSVLRKMRPVR